MDPSAYHPLRSIESRRKCKLFFHNNSTRNIDIIWLNYEGDEQLYRSLGPHHSFTIDSFVTHPWIIRDQERRNVVLVDLYQIKKEHFLAIMARKEPFENLITSSCRVVLPSVHPESELLFILITNGVYTLRELCFQTLCDAKLSLRNSELVPPFIAQELEQYRKGQQLVQLQIDQKCNEMEWILFSFILLHNAHICPLLKIIYSLSHESDETKLLISLCTLSCILLKCTRQYTEKVGVPDIVGSISFCDHLNVTV